MKLEPETLDALSELVGLGIGKAADVLNTMLDSHIALTAPCIRLIRTDQLIPELSASEGDKLSAVQMRYAGSLDGSVELIFSTPEAGRLVDCIIGDEQVVEEGLDAIRAGTLCEVGNIVINALIGTISNALSFHLDYSVPSYLEGDAALLVSDAGIQGENIVLLAETQFSVEMKNIRGNIAVFFSMVSFESLKRQLGAVAGISS